MKKLLLALALAASPVGVACADDAAWPPERKDESIFTERKLETFEHGVKPEWGYAAPQRDTFMVLHPKYAQQHAPLYVVLHSAGHDVRSCLDCTKTVGNHDIYRAPDDFLGLYVDCRANQGVDWWWGVNKFPGHDVSPPEKRVLDTVKWVLEKYGADADRVYLCGNSMGGSGTLGLGMRHGDVFAAIKANVPAEVKHVSQRMYFDEPQAPEGLTIADPPIVIDYSAQNDSWSRGHEGFIKAMNDRKYALFMYWGPFGHANNHAQIEKVNDLVNTFDWLQVKKNELYPVFTNASTNDQHPWPDHTKEQMVGQINAFFRWKTVSDAPAGAETQLFLATPETLKTTLKIPTESTADVSLRRLQGLKIAPGQKVVWSFGAAKGEATADAHGLVTIPKLKITATPTSLVVKPAK